MFETKPNLFYLMVAPARVADCRLVRSPESFLRGRKGTALLTSLGEAHLLIDFEKEIVGGVEVRLSCDRDTHIEIVYEEEKEAVLRREPYVSSWYRQPKDEFDLPAGEHHFYSRGRRGFRYAALYATGGGEVELQYMQAINGGWIVADRGFFRCSDDRLNRIWDMSRETVRACMQDFYEDGVKRDGLLWIGDYRVSFLAGWYAFGDGKLARRSLLMIRDSQLECGAIPACCAEGGGHQHDRENGITYMPGIPRNLGGWVILNYLADYICAIEEYIVRTGDQSILAEILDSAEKTARFMLTLTDLETPGQWWIDDFEAKRDERGLRYTIHHDCKNMPNMNIASKGGVLCEMLMGLNALERLAKRAGNGVLAAWARLQAVRLDGHIERNYHEAYFGQYTDLMNQKAPAVSQHVTIRAILAGKKDEKGMERLARMPMPNIGFAMSWRIEAMMRAGYGREALKDICTVWGRMLDMDSLTCWERQDVPELNAAHYYDAPGSFCHGWTAGPCWQLPAWIVGVRPAGDGFERIVVEPNLVDLDWAEASVPVPQGEITVRAEKNGSGMTILLDLPECVRDCTVRWPDGNEVKLTGGKGYVLKSGK